jgi:hypothetical protein
VIIDEEELFNFNAYSDGKSIQLMHLLDKYFGINEEFPEKQYEFFNTSFIDAISITAILSVSIILFII